MEMFMTPSFWVLAASTVIQSPRNAGMGVVILLLGVPVYFFWKRRRPGFQP